MNKTIVTIISIVVIFFAVYMGTQIFRNNKTKNDTDETQNIAEIAEEIIDDCTDEWEEYQKEIEAQANTEEETKLSPNCSFIFKTYYTKCGHITRKYINIPTEMVNKTEEEIKEIYKEWLIEKFENNEVIFSKIEDSECGEHYILRDREGNIVIYNILENGEEVEYEKTDITIEYLPDEDKNTIKNGLQIFGKENLNKTLEDFE